MKIKENKMETAVKVHSCVENLIALNDGVKKMQENKYKKGDKIAIIANYVRAYGQDTGDVLLTNSNIHVVNVKMMDNSPTDGIDLLVDGSIFQSSKG